ncbi:hypothetical protein UK82_10680 [Frankia sp. ACN1ag]|nr:hypothetical protein UK82_10680 [Frankia sp. ACN1ag]
MGDDERRRGHRLDLQPAGLLRAEEAEDVAPPAGQRCDDGQQPHRARHPADQASRPRPQPGRPPAGGACRRRHRDQQQQRPHLEQRPHAEVEAGAAEPGPRHGEHRGEGRRGRQQVEPGQRHGAERGDPDHPEQRRATVAPRQRDGHGEVGEERQHDERHPIGHRRKGVSELR